MLETLRDTNDHRRRPEKGRSSSRPQHLTQCLTSRWGLGIIYGISDKILRGILHGYGRITQPVTPLLKQLLASKSKI